jgi:UDP-N-acetylmuramate--alanine ligase
VALFQPHLYSRTRDFAVEFGRSLLGADVAIVTDVYPSREKPLPGVTGQLVVRAAREAGHRNLVYVADKKRVPERLERILRPGDLLLTMGAGDVVRLGESYLAGEGMKRIADAGK